MQKWFDIGLPLRWDTTLVQLVHSRVLCLLHLHLVNVTKLVADVRGDFLNCKRLNERNQLGPHFCHELVLGQAHLAGCSGRKEPSLVTSATVMDKALYRRHSKAVHEMSLDASVLELRVL